MGWQNVDIDALTAKIIHYVSLNFDYKNKL